MVALALLVLPLATVTTAASVTLSIDSDLSAPSLELSPIPPGMMFALLRVSYSCDAEGNCRLTIDTATVDTIP